MNALLPGKKINNGRDMNNNEAFFRVFIDAMLSAHGRNVTDPNAMRCEVVMKTENTALKQLAGEMQTALTEHHESERNQQSRFDSLHAAITEESSSQHTAFDAAQEVKDSE